MSFTVQFSHRKLTRGDERRDRSGIAIGQELSLIWSDESACYAVSQTDQGATRRKLLSIRSRLHVRYMYLRSDS